jgi:hypothetical protein
VGNLEFVRANAKRGESANAVVQEIVLLKSVEEKGNQDAWVKKQKVNVQELIGEELVEKQKMSVQHPPLSLNRY